MERSFSRAVSASLRGVMQGLIILSHLYFATGLQVFWLANKLGTTIIAFYFFISGYGLMVGVQHAETVSVALKNFLPRRLKGLLIPFVYAVLLYWVAMWGCYGSSPSLTWLNLLPNGWFVFVLVWLYIAFYIALKLAGRRYEIAVILILIACVLQMYISYSLGHERAWWMTTLGFASGTLYAVYEGICWSWLRRLWMIGLGGILVIGIMALDCVEILPLAYLVIPMLLVALLNRVGYTSFIDTPLSDTRCSRWRRAARHMLRFLSEMSYELYLVHGIMIIVASRLPIYYEHPYLYAFVVLVSSVLVAWLSHRLLSYLYRLL